QRFHRHFRDPGFTTNEQIFFTVKIRPYDVGGMPVSTNLTVLSIPPVLSILPAPSVLPALPNLPISSVLFSLFALSLSTILPNLPAPSISTVLSAHVRQHGQPILRDGFPMAKHGKLPFLLAIR